MLIGGQESKAGTAQNFLEHILKLQNGIMPDVTELKLSGDITPSEGRSWTNRTKGRDDEGPSR